MKVGQIRRALEKGVQGMVWQLLTAAGCFSYWLSQPRETKQTPGVPDLITFSPKRGLAFIEVKRDDGKGRQSGAQKRFQLLCQFAGITYLLGGVEEVRAWLAGADHGATLPPAEAERARMRRALVDALADAAEWRRRAEAAELRVEQLDDMLDTIDASLPLAQGIA